MITYVDDFLSEESNFPDSATKMGWEKCEGVVYQQDTTFRNQTEESQR